MSRERYRRPERWDSERFAMERERDLSRYGSERERYEEREPRFVRESIPLRPRERSVDEIYERRGPKGYYEDDEYRKKVYYDEPEERHSPRFAREPRRPRGESIAINIERGREPSPSPPRRAAKPMLVRRQSSLDTFDRKPFSPPWREREEYGPPARRETFRREREDYRPPAYAPIPLPRTRALMPARRYEREIEVAEPDYYGDDAFRPYPERVREREIIRTRRNRSRSQEAHSKRASSVSSKSSSSSSSVSEAAKSEFPKRGKTRMPGRLVSKKAIIELGYPFEEEGETIIIQKALGRENIDEVIRLSEEFKSTETKTVYRVPGQEMSGGRSNAGDIIEEKKTERIEEVIEVPAPPKAPSPEPPREIIEEKTTTVERREVSPARSYHHYQESGPIIVHGKDTRMESDFIRRDKHVEILTHPTPVGPLALVPERSRDARAISAEIRALEAEKEALRAEKRAMRRERREGRESGDLVLYEERVERVRDPEPSGGVRIERDRKEEARAKAIRTMLKTLT